MKHTWWYIKYTLCYPVAYLECAKGGSPGGLWDGTPPVGSRGKAPVGGLGGRSLTEADAFLLLNA